MEIIMLGAPSAGKSAQAKKITVKYQIPYISTGDILRASTKNGTKLGMKARAFTDASGLVPNEITIDMLLGRIHEADCQDGYVLDKSPGTTPQAENLTKALGEMGESVDYAVNVDAPDESIIKHTPGHRTYLTCGATYHIELSPPKKEGTCDVYGQVLVLRDDDKPETIRERLNVYHDRTQPLIEYYQKAGVLAQVDGTMDMEGVFQAVVKILGA